MFVYFHFSFYNSFVNQRLISKLDEKWSANECRLVWINSVNPKINREKWNADEEEHLKKLARKYRERNWLSISFELNVSVRISNE